LRRATRYLNGEASITGYRTSAYRPWLLRGIRDGMPGKRARQLGRPFHALAKLSKEETGGIRRSRRPTEHGRESDGVIVPKNPETT